MKRICFCLCGIYLIFVFSHRRLSASENENADEIWEILHTQYQAAAYTQRDILINGFHEFIRSYPKHPNIGTAHYKLARLYAYSGDVENERHHYETVINEFPDAQQVPQALFWLAENAFAQDKLEDTRKHYRALIEDYPTHPRSDEAKKYLSSLKNHQDTQTLFRRAVDTFTPLLMTKKHPLSFTIENSNASITIRCVYHIDTFFLIEFSSPLIQFRIFIKDNAAHIHLPLTNKWYAHRFQFKLSPELSTQESVNGRLTSEFSLRFLLLDDTEETKTPHSILPPAELLGNWLYSLADNKHLQLEKNGKERIIILSSPSEDMSQQPSSISLHINKKNTLTKIGFHDYARFIKNWEVHSITNDRKVTTEEQFVGKHDEVSTNAIINEIGWLGAVEKGIDYLQSLNISSSDPLLNEVLLNALSHAFQADNALYSMHMQNRQREIIASMEPLISKNNDDTDALYKRAEAYARSGQFENAVEDYKSIIKIDEEHRDAYIGLAMTLLIAGESATAAKVAQNIFLTLPKDAKVSRTMGKCVEFINKKLAIDYYKKSIKLDPAYDEGYTSLAILLHNAGRTDEAIDYLQSGKEKTPDSYIIHALLGLILIDIGKFEDAQRALQKAVGLHTNEDTFNRIRYNLIRLQLHEQ